MSELDDPDVVVIGGGLAGLTAATRAAELGLRVRVLEQSTEELYLCNSRYTGGLFHVAMDDMSGDPAWVGANVLRVTHGEGSAELAGTLAANARRTLAWLRRQGVRLIKAGPDGLRKNSLAPPGVRRTGLRWRGRSGDVMLRTLGTSLQRRGGTIHRGVEVRHLLMEAGRCVGVAAREAGREIEIRAACVVIADGGFQANPELLRRYISPAPERLLMRNAGTGCGAGLRMAEAVGAKLIGMESFYGHVQFREAMTDQRFWPYPVLDALATAGIVVDAHARRFCDEGLGGVYITNAIARLADPLSAVIVFDSDIWNGPGRDWLLPANPFLLRAGGTLDPAETLYGLAQRASLPAESLIETVGAHNAAVGGAPRAGPPRTTTGIKAWPIARPPFYAVPVCAGVTYTMGGIATDTRARVLDTNDRPIEGLLAAGATTGGLEGFSHAGYSGGLSKSAVFGLIAGDTLGEMLIGKITNARVA